MPRFNYKAVNESGDIFKGSITAFDERDVEQRLQGKGLTLISGREHREKHLPGLGLNSVKPRMVMEFYHRLSQSLNLGLPIMSSLDDDSMLMPSKAMKKIIQETRVGLESGKTFYESMSRFPKVFERLDLSIIRMGEETCGKTPKDERRKTLAAFSSGILQYVVNVGVLTEGFDDPGVEVIVMGRPTESRSLYAQMVGRATRPLPGLVDGLDLPAERVAAIAGSAKPHCLVIDFVGNAGKHKLMTSADILGGNVSDEAIERATLKAKEANAPVDMAAMLEAEEQNLQAERAKAAARAAGIKARAIWAVKIVNPFDIFQIQPAKTRAWHIGKQLSEKQAALLTRQGIDASTLEYAQAKQLLDEIFRRFDYGLCSYRQAKHLRRHGYTGNETRAQASVLLDGIFGGRTRRAAEVARG